MLVRLSLELAFPDDEHVREAETTEASNSDASEEKIENLADMICRCGDEPETKSAALLVLMSAIENATHPQSCCECGEARCFCSLR